jgi:hypothetical protein
VGNSVASRSAYGFFGPYGGCGAAILCKIEDGYLPEISHCTFYGNTAGSVGSAVFGYLNPIQVSNCIFWENTSTNYPSNYYDVISLAHGPFGGVTLLDSYADYCLFEGLESSIVGLGNIVDDPMFADPDLRDFHLLPISPAIDAGDPNYIPSGLADIDGQPRLMGSRVDIGVDEFYFFEEAYLFVTPGSLTFTGYEAGSDPNDQNLTITNYGNQSLNWSITDFNEITFSPPAWLTISPTSGTLVLGDSNDVTLSANITGLPAGQYSYAFDVSDPAAQNSPQTVTVDLEVIGPILDVSSTAFSFTALEGGANPTDQTLTVSNTGGGTVNWSIDTTGKPAWLTISPVSGVLTNGQSEPVTLSADISGLPGGQYSYAFDVSDPNAQNSPQTVTVDLEVIGPIIEAAPSSFNFYWDAEGVNPPDQILSISNSGGVTLNWQISESCDWLTATPLTGTSTGEVDEVILSVDVTGLEIGNAYECSLMLSDPNAENNPVTIPVVVEYWDDCLTPDHMDYDDWVVVGKPDSWCWQRQCHGDGDNATERYGRGSVWVGFNDIYVLLDAFQVASPTLEQLAADFNRRDENYGRCSVRVGYDDLDVLLYHFQNPSVPNDCGEPTHTTP